MNTVCILGNLTWDPEIRTTTSGKHVCSFSVACDYYASGEKKTDFVPCVAWNQTADYLYQYGRKGVPVSVEGRVTSRSYESKDGRTVHVTEILARSVSLPGSRKTDADEVAEPYGYAAAEPAQEAKPAPKAQPKAADQVQMDFYLGKTTEEALEQEDQDDGDDLPF